MSVRSRPSSIDTEPQPNIDPNPTHSMTRRTRVLKRELEVPDEGASEVFFKYHEVSRARAGELLGEAIDESLSIEIEPLESTGPTSSIAPKAHETMPAPEPAKSAQGGI